MHTVISYFLLCEQGDSFKWTCWIGSRFTLNDSKLILYQLTYSIIRSKWAKCRILGNFYFFFNTFQRVIIVLLHYISRKHVIPRCPQLRRSLPALSHDNDVWFHEWADSFQWTYWIISQVAMNDSFENRTDQQCSDSMILSKPPGTRILSET